MGTESGVLFLLFLLRRDKMEEPPSKSPAKSVDV